MDCHTLHVAIKLNASKEGFYIGGTYISALLFVDDIVLIARTRAAAERLLSILEESIEDMGMEINFSKTKYLEFNPDNTDPMDSSIYDEETTKVYHELYYKYLGLTGK